MPHEELPCKIQGTIVRESFRYDSPPGSVTLPDTWTDTPDGTFTTESTHALEVLGAGELVYGTSLSGLQRLGTPDKANYALEVDVVARERLRFEIRGRRQDANNFISMFIDFQKNQISIRKTTSGTVTSLEGISHNLRFVDAPTGYTFELWMFNNSLTGFINGANLIETTSSSFTGDHGISLYVPEIFAADAATFHGFRVHELITQPSPQLEDDGSDLHVAFRKLLKKQVETPVLNNYKEFLKARLLWKKYKDLGRLDIFWKDLGYPIQEPVTEDWFVTTTEDPYL